MKLSSQLDRKSNLLVVVVCLLCILVKGFVVECVKVPSRKQRKAPFGFSG